MSKVSIQLAGVDLSATNPAFVEANIQTLIRNGQGFIGTSGNLATNTNGNLLVCAISLFNASNSGKNILIYSIQVFQNGTETGSEQWRATTADPNGGSGFTGACTTTNMNLGSATASVASLCCTATGVTASVTPTGNLMGVYGANSNTPNELLSNGGAILLPNGSAHGIEVLTKVNNAGNSYSGQVKWVEY